MLRRIIVAIGTLFITLAMTEGSTGTKSWRECLDQAFGDDIKPASFMFDFDTQLLTGGEVWFLKATTTKMPRDTYFAFVKPHNEQIRIDGKAVRVDDENGTRFSNVTTNIGTYEGSTVVMESDNSKCTHGHEIQHSRGGMLTTFGQNGHVVTARGFVLATDYVSTIVNAVTYVDEELGEMKSPEVHVFVTDSQLQLKNSDILKKAGKILCGEEFLSGLKDHTITKAVERAHHKCLSKTKTSL